jgi:trehalose utilization protein
MSIKVTVWNEYLHEKENREVAALYPKGIHGCIADMLLEQSLFEVRTATLEEAEHGLSDSVLDDTDVLIWWGHKAHERVRDDVASKVANRVLKGMGLIVLHSGHLAKPFRLLMGTSCTLKWRDNDFERIWTVMPAHPIARGIPEYFELDREEMYGEYFDIPQPDELVFAGWFAGGELFRSGCCWRRGYGKVFYFQPGHEFNPTYYDENIRTVIRNATAWAAPIVQKAELSCPLSQPSPEELRKSKEL